MAFADQTPSAHLRRVSLDGHDLCEILVPIEVSAGRSGVSGVMYTSVTPSAARLTESLRDIGYDFPAAVADIVDNAIAAGATRIEIEIRFDGADSWVSIADDGVGMSVNGLMEAMRYGSSRHYGRHDLGRYGLGLKTASLSQCRSVTVVSRTRSSSRTAARMIDLDVVAEYDEWAVITPGADEHVARSRELVADTGGTVVVWRKLDRVLPEKRPEGGWARRRLEGLADRTAEHLGIVFHRFIEGAVGDRLVITVNGVKVAPWNPFAPDEPACTALPSQRFEIAVGESAGAVTLRPYVLPSRSQFSSPAEFDRLSALSADPNRSRERDAISGGTVYDLIYNPRETALLRWAREAGAETLDGLEMLVGQACLQFTWWTGREAPADVMKAAAEAFITEHHERASASRTPARPFPRN